MRRNLLAGLLYLLGALIGVAAFSLPFLQPVSVPTAAAERAVVAPALTPLLTTVLLAVCLLAILVEMQGARASAKVVAALGMLVAATSVLRFVETAIPGPGGFSPIFGPIILAGYVFGARFGFLMGSFTILVSALITGGVGPWLPYQMFVASWVGFSAGLIPQIERPRLALLVLALFAAVWGILFGFITNLYFWPFFAGELHMSWQPGIGLVGGVQRYLAFYAATSLAWDLVRAVGNVVLVLALGLPAVRALQRFRDRFYFTWDGAPQSDAAQGAQQP